MASRLADSTLREVLAAFAAETPTPAGGSACATASAMGAALLMMAASFAGGAQHTLAGIQEQLIDAIDADAVAYRHVIDAQKQPRGSQAERTLRTAAIQLALRHATDVPLSIMRLSAEALAEAESLAGRVHRSAVGDTAVALSLLRAGFDGARATVDANLGSLKDAEYVGATREECRLLSERAGRASGEAERLLRIG